MVVKIIIVIFLCAALSRRAKGEEEECHIYEKESPKIKNQHVTELAGTIFKELKDQPYLKLDQTAAERIPGDISFAIVYGDGDSKSIVNIIHLKSKNDVDESASDSIEYFEFF